MSRQSEAKNRYDAKSYDRLSIIIPKGSKEGIKAAAAAAGVSVNRYILESVEQRSGLKLTLDGELPALRAKKEKD